MILLNLPTVNHFLCNKVSEALSHKLGTEVEINDINLGIFNRIVVDNLLIYDQNNEQMLSASRASAKINYLDLVNGKITINAAQLFGLKANLYKKDIDDQANFQFIIDSLSSKDKDSHTPLNLQIRSLIIRHGQIAYNVKSVPEDDRLTQNHINLSDISAHLILNILTDDSLNLNIKKFAFKEEKGLTLKRLTAKCIAGRSTGMIEDFIVELPNSSISIPSIDATYAFNDGKLDKSSLNFNCPTARIAITPSDLRCFVPILNSYSSPVNIQAEIKESDNTLAINNIHIKQGNDLDIKGDGILKNWLDNNLEWNINLNDVRTSSQGIRNIAENLSYAEKIPDVIDKLGNIKTNIISKGNMNEASINGALNADCGNLEYNINKVASRYKAELNVDNIDLGALANYTDLGNLSSTIQANGEIIGNSINELNVKAAVSDFNFRGHNYNDIKITADLSKDKMLRAKMNVTDKSGNIAIDADYDMASKEQSGLVHAVASHFHPEHLGLTDMWPDTSFDFQIDADINGNDFNNAYGNVNVSNFHMQSPRDDYSFNSLSINKSKSVDGFQQAILKSDFASIRTEGHFDYNTLIASLTNAIRHHLPTLPGLPEPRKTDNQMNLYGTINSTEFVEKLLNYQIRIFEPVHIIANIDDSKHQFNLNIDASHFVYDNKEFRDGFAIMSSPNDTLKARINLGIVNSTGNTSYYLIKSNAIDNHLTTNIDINSKGKYSINGSINADARFFTDEKDESVAHINILPSDLTLSDSLWTIKPSSVIYYKDHLKIDHFDIRHDNQHISVNGLATKNPYDEIEMNLKDVNVEYILDLLNFHSVEFAGTATGRAKVRSLFDKPDLEAHLNVKDFHFETGELGTLIADANWNLDEGSINIDGIVMDGEHHSTVKGYVSPKNNDIDLNVHADGIQLGFIEKYTNSFINNINARGWGNVEVVGPLKAIQLVGDARVEGGLSVVPLNTSYTLRNGKVKLVPDNIHFDNDSLYDVNGNIGVVNGDLNHQHLGHFTYDINVLANNILAMDIKDFGDDTFCGTIYATGTCNIRDKNGDVVIDVNATPEKGSVLAYNAASPDAITNREFIHWNDRNKRQDTSLSDNRNGNTAERSTSSNFYLNLLIHSNPNATLKVLMDQTTGDYIALQGNGVIRASYYNKGTFDLFGNYVVNNGIYTLTVQNLLKREFEFQPGGTIAFGGDAYNAALNLQALYTVNGVPLSDINIGKSFTNNNVRVDCLMNISGTPGQPHVDFSLDIPTVSTDAKQMIMSLMNSEEEINQQVLYLLAVGRFLNQSNNSSYNDASRQSQTSLAMQSILSGTLSQQLSSVLSNVVPNNNWNLGANISTGDEGFNNAEYEGLLSGRLLNNRLLLNGQFGYRDNENTTSTFIGDFDIRYLLVPSGNAAVKVYNQTNDKYFTKNSLNTQGVGIIIKKDFNNIGDLLPKKKHKQKVKSGK